MMNLRKKILEKEAWLGTSQEAGEDGVMKMWIEMVSDILYVKVINFQVLLIHIVFFILEIITNLIQVMSLLTDMSPQMLVITFPGS